MLTDTDRFAATLAERGLPPLRRRRPTTLQVNLGKVCNQACRHCHVDAGPTRTESMQAATVERVLALLAHDTHLTTLDVTGGAPELNPHFRTLVSGARRLERRVIDRCNLTVLSEPGQEDTAEFLAAHQVHVVASLPCYTAENVDAQRGGGAFAGSVAGLRRLNALGYGAAEGGDALPGADQPLRLDLVYNPLGPSLPPEQGALEADYRVRLAADLGVRFDRLLCLANMPIHRFADDLARQGRLDSYVDQLRDAFNPEALDGLMCRDLVSIDHDGTLADCDFNQMLGLPLGGRPRSIFDIESLSSLQDDAIATASHCLGCTAGQGSSCGGALGGASSAP